MTLIYVILAAVLLAIVALTIVLLARRKKAKAAAGGEEPGAGGDEIALLIREAEAKLSSAKLERGARVGNLPVLLLMGDAGSTKTSVMLNSGLDPELLAGQVYQDNEVAPTRTANLWFSRRTLFVEAGGGLLADAAKWKQLVKRLAPRASVVSRGEQAPRAAVLCFDCENFTRPGAQEAAAASARALRARLGEISQALGIHLPVYVLFTKLDRLPFFLEYVRNLSHEEATQVLGVTLPMAGERGEGVYAEQETARLGENFERLFRSLADARPEFLSREQEAARLPGAYEFPREFRKIRPVLVQFLVDLCRPSQLTTGPFLRGFYFTGVRPVVINEAAPVTAAPREQQGGYEAPPGATGIFGAGAAARRQQQAAAQPVMGTRKVPQWMFLTHLFHDILLADKSAMGASGASTRTSGARRLLFAAAASFCLLATILFTVSFFKNRALAAEVRDAAQGITSTPVAGGELAARGELQKLETLRQSLERLTAWHRGGAPWGYRFGLYTGDELYPEARRIYFARFQQLLLVETQNGILGFLRTLPPKPGPEYGPTYEALKAYLITTSNHDKSTRSFLSPALMRWWKGERTVDAERTGLAQKQFDFYSEELREANPFSSENDTGAIAKARRYLTLFEGTDRVYALMVAEAGKPNEAVDFNRKFPEAAKVVAEPHVVPGAFSKGGWNFMKDAIPHPDRYFAGEEWVLGKEAGTQQAVAASIQEAVRKRYYADFVKEWRTYIRSAAVQKYNDIPDAAEKLGQTSGAQSPLLALLCLASENTAVDELEVTSVFQPVQAVVPPGCSGKYTGPSNQNYMGALVKLQASLEAIQGEPTDAAAAPTLSNALEAKVATRQMAQGFRSDSDLGGNVQKLLEDPITNAEGVLKGLGPAALNKKGKDLCAQIRPILNKFPFNPVSPNDATIQDVNAIFAPKGGAVWQFYDSSLAKHVTRQGAPVAGSPLQLTPAFQKYLARVAAFTDAAYANGSADPHLKYVVRPNIGPDTERIHVNIDGQAADFTASAGPKTFAWPGPAQGMQLTVRAKGGQDQAYPDYPGLWSVFHFVSDADRRVGTLVEMTLRAGKQGRYVLNPVSNQPFTVRLDITADPPVFDKGYFSGLGCVAEVARQ